jgi:hypothetical protein
VKFELPFEQMFEFLSRMDEKLDAMAEKVDHAQPHRYLKRREGAEYLRLSQTQFDNLTREGLILRAKLGRPGDRSAVLFDIKDLDAFVKAHAE